MKTLGYIARAECYQVKYHDGSIATADGTVVTFAMSEGYPQCSDGRDGYLFISAGAARSAMRNWDGMPWMYRLKVVEVEPAKTAVVEEREVL